MSERARESRRFIGYIMTCHWWRGNTFMNTNTFLYLDDIFNAISTDELPGRKDFRLILANPKRNGGKKKKMGGGVLGGGSNGLKGN